MVRPGGRAWGVIRGANRARGRAGDPYAAQVEVAVLGPVEVKLDGSPVDLGTPKQRALVAALALSGGRPVSVDTSSTCSGATPRRPGVSATLQAYVSGLRRVHRARPRTPRPGHRAGHRGPGLRAAGRRRRTDAGRFEADVRARQRALQSPRSRSVRPRSAATCSREAVAGLDEALALWRGTPYGELGDAPQAVAERARLEELRLVALEHRMLAELALGHHGTVAAELEALTAAHPLRERLWHLRALALARAGRQADALDVLSRLRTVLADELGLEPGAELRDLQAAVLRQDPALDWVAPADGQPPRSPPSPSRSRSPAGPPAPSSRWRRGRWWAGTRTSRRWSARSTPRWRAPRRTPCSPATRASASRG